MSRRQPTIVKCHRQPSSSEVKCSQVNSSHQYVNVELDVTSPDELPTRSIKSFSRLLRIQPTMSPPNSPSTDKTAIDHDATILSTSGSDTPSSPHGQKLIEGLEFVRSQLTNLQADFKERVPSNAIKNAIKISVKRLTTMIEEASTKPTNDDQSSLTTSVSNGAPDVLTALQLLIAPLTAGLASIVAKVDATQRDVDELKKSPDVNKNRQPTEQSSAKTYAKAATNASKKRQPKTTPSAPRAVKPSFSFVAWSVDDSSTQDATRQLIEKKINLADHKCSAPKVSSLSNKKIRYEFTDESSCSAVMGAVSRLTEINAEPTKKRQPNLILKGVSKDIPDDEIVARMVAQNQTISDLMKTDDVANHIKLVSRKPSVRSPDRLTNVIIETSADVRTALLNSERVSIGFGRVHVEQMSTFVQCFKCFGFGHTTKHCSSADDTCGHCAGNHRFKACDVKEDKSSPPVCINCKKSNEATSSTDDTAHVPMSSKCPHVTKMTKKAIKRTHNA